MIRRFTRGLALLLTALTTVAVLTGCQKEAPVEENRIGYAEGTTAIGDGSSLADAVGAMLQEAEEEAANGMWLDYAANLYSDNGIDFTCLLGNASDNTRDMFFAMYGDAAHTDELFLSGLLRPGSALEQITLNHAVDPGTHAAYVVFTSVGEDEDGRQVMFNQREVSVNLNVTQ